MKVETISHVADPFPAEMLVKWKGQSFCTQCARSVSRCETCSLNDKLGNVPNVEMRPDRYAPLNMMLSCLLCEHFVVIGDAVP